MTTIPFQIQIPEADLDDLRRRLAATRWPDEQADVGWEQGVPLQTMRELAGYWADGFDWRARERRFNAWPQITTTADETRVHAIHARAPDPAAPALLVLHGWPSTFADYAELIDPLSEHFHVVVPSLPGFAFSGPTPGPGWGNRRMGGAMADLMSQLGYERFGVHGVDVGAGVARWMGIDHAERITRLHVCGIVGGPDPDDELTPDEQARLDGRQEYMMQRSGYALEQSQAPQTLAYGLTDSPAGQLAWIGEKLMHHWPDPNTPIDRDAVLTTVSLYWLTTSAASAARVYWEGGREGAWYKPPEPSHTPTAVAVFPNGLAGQLPIRRFAERVNEIVRWTEFDRGGHFPALEVPDLLLGDIVATFG